MAFVKVDDGTGTLDIVVFPRIFGATKEQWVDYKPLIISGRIDYREDKLNLLVEEVNYDTAQANDLQIKIPASAGQTELKALKELLLQYPGQDSATLVFEGQDKRIKLSFGINWSEDLAHLIANVLE